jgi:translocation and assembly module TamB
MRLDQVREKQKKPLTHNRWQSAFSRKSLFFSFLGGFVLFGGITGMNWGVAHSQQQLVPEVTRLLTATLDRPVQLGAIEQVSLTHLRIGRSAIPATDTDRDQVTVEVIEIRFDPVAALWQRRVNLTVTLIRPVAFFDQDATGNWSNLEIELDGDEPIQVKQVRLRDATIVLSPRAKALRSLVNNPEAQDIPVASGQVTFQQVNLNLSLAEPGHPLKFQLTGQSSLGGRFSLRGAATPETQTADLWLETEQLAVTSLNPFLPETARLDWGELSSRLRVQLDPAEPIALNGKANLSDLAIQVEGEPNLFTQTTGQFRFQGQTITVRDGHTTYGQIPFDQVHGTIHLQQGLDLRGKVLALPIPAFLHTFDLGVPFETKGKLQTTGLRATGPIDGAIFSGTVHDVEPVQLDRVGLAAVEARFTYDTGSDRVNLHKVDFFPQAGGVIANRGVAILGEADQGESDDLMLDLEVQQVPADTIARLYGVTLPGFELGALNARARVAVIKEVPDIQAQWQLDQATYPAQGQVVLGENQLRLQNTQIQVADQMIRVEGKLADDRWQFMAQGADLPMQHFWPDLSGQVTGVAKLAGTLDRPLDSILGEIQAQWHTPEGSVSADGQIDQGRWQAQIQSQGMALGNVSPDLPGILTGQIEIVGSLNNLTPAGMQANAQIQLSEGISRHTPFLNQPLTAALQWTGDRLNIQQARTAELDLSGWIAARLDAWQRPAITSFDLGVQLQDYNLATLPLPASWPITPQGQADLRGRMTGTPIAPNLEAQVRLHQFAVNQLAFEPLLSGHVQYTPSQGLDLNVLGNRDQIVLRLDEHYRLNALTLRLDQALVQTTTRSGAEDKADRLLAIVQNFPLETLNLSPAEGWGAVTGLLSGRFNLALGDSPSLNGELIVDRPALGAINVLSHPHHAHDRFVAQVQYADRTLALTEGNLQLGTGNYRLAGSLRQDDSLVLTGELMTESGRLQDIARLVAPAAWQAMWRQGGRTRLPASPNPWQHFLVAQSGQPPQPEISTDSVSPDAVLASPSGLPALSELQGNFSTQIRLQHSQLAGLAVDFNLQGRDWHWGNYGVQQVTIGNGRLNGKDLLLSPVRLQGLVYAPPDQPAQTFETAVTFDGQIGDRASGQFQASTVPAMLLGRIFNLPIPLTGTLQATATLAGSSDNPEVRGMVETTGIHLNTRQIQDLQMMFQYKNQQFQVDDWRLRE